MTVKIRTTRLTFNFLHEKVGQWKDFSRYNFSRAENISDIANIAGSSLVRIESETLERLLEALDMRHVSGWYQPAMRLQAHIHHLYGVNEALREELHTCR